MPEIHEIAQVKSALSGQLLGAALQKGPVAHEMFLTVSAAVDNAGTNTHAVGIGVKVVGGEPTGDLCVRVYVVQKIAKSLLRPQDVIPPEIDGVQTDVIESPPAVIHADPPMAQPCSFDRKLQQRPVIGGISAAQYEVTAGTIAYLCRSTAATDDPEATFVLSNNHVFANLNRASIGDDIYQQSPLDGGAPADKIASLHRFVTLNLDGTENRVDAAIGKLADGIASAATLCMIGSIDGTADATPTMAIRKHGRTSGYTEGIVSDVDYDAIVGMDHNDPTIKAVFNGQIRLEPVAPYPAIGLGGDSGSLVVEKSSQKAVGLYFAGPSTGSYGVANQISDVLEQLQITLT